MTRILPDWFLAAAPACLALLFTACSHNVGVDAPDAGTDARIRTGPYDECGNGMDDDADGRIDEGCFCGGGETQPCFRGTYPNRGVGACADGVQRCDAMGSTEFGHWGACEMDTLPSDEACDGVDNDCDGATDEGCPCTEGQTQGCGSEFAIAPCRAGTQSCRADGTWSACEGAVGPSAETCGDGIDNDCDGLEDEGCACVPEPEVCDDGVDNDCDGAVDEPSCRSLPDGGVDAGGDGGTDGGSGCDFGDDPPPPGPDGCDPTLAAPRQIAPLSTGRVTSKRPSLELQLVEGATARIELSRSPRFGAGTRTLEASGSRTRPPMALEQGAWFWRARSVQGGRVSCEVTPVWELWVPRRDSPVDTSWGSVMDVNLDGYADALIGLGNSLLRGTVYMWLFLGGPDGLSDEPVMEWRSESECMGSACHGAQLTPGASLGDLNGDGYPELAIFSQRSWTTRVVHVHGCAEDVIVETEPAASCYSVGARAAGDVNHDGYGDVLGCSGRDRAWHIRYGSPAGPGEAVPIPQAYSGGQPLVWGIGDANGDGYADLATGLEVESLDRRRRQLRILLGGSDGFTQILEENSDWVLYLEYFPNRHAVGDFNGDGYADFLVTGSGYSVTKVHRYVYYGGPAGPSLATRTVEYNDACKPAWVVHGAGDMNGDGYDDVHVPWRSIDVVHGSADGLARADRSVAYSPEVLPVPFKTGALLGDVDGDGYDDIVMGVRCTVGDRVMARVYRGGPEGYTEARTQLIHWPESFSFTDAECTRERYRATAAGEAFNSPNQD